MRIRIFASICFFCMAVVIGGLAYVQIGKYQRYKIMSEENRLRIIPLMAPRGRIFDRNEIVLAKDNLCFEVSVLYGQIKDEEKLENILRSVLGVSQNDIKANIKKSKKQPYVSIPIADDIDIGQAIAIEEETMDCPGLLLEASCKRCYIYGKTMSNVIGYLGLINRAEFEKLKQYGYLLNDIVGRDGVEKYYDEYLRGKYGGKQIEVDHFGRECATLGFKEPISGMDIYLTIDIALQKFCEELLKDKKGAITVIDPETGQVFAMVSAPSYAPDIFIEKNNKKGLETLFKNKNYPMLNRAIAAAYPPGSVIKGVVATAALEEKVVTSEKSFECPGFFLLGGITFHCWLEKGHGMERLKEALRDSCNVYFFNAGLLLGEEKIAGYMKKFGIGECSGIDLPGEIPGILPTRDWKKKFFKESWYKGDTANYSIGQGYLLATPIQIARMMSVFANKGYLVRPYVTEKIGKVIVGSVKRVNVGISSESLEKVRRALKEVVNHERGTGMKARLDEITVAGKTGTAQTSRGISHGWFAGFAPFDNPKLTVVVFDEYGSKGGFYAAETAGQIFKKAHELGLL